MGSNRGFHEKMDALDLIINALLGHEKQLDAISHRLENLSSHATITEKTRITPEAQRIEPRVVEKPPRIVFHNWFEYTASCLGVKMVAFEVEENRFHVYTPVEGRIYTYVEFLPETRMKVSEDPTNLSIKKASLSTIDHFHFLIGGRLKCGLTLSIESSRTLLKENEYLFELRYNLEPDEVKTFLSKAFNISKGQVVEGKITF